MGLRRVPPGDGPDRPLHPRTPRPLPREAILRAVNDTWDNDTGAAIVGAAVGALHGRKALPKEWIDGLLGWTGAHDDGRVVELITEAREPFWDI